MSATVKDFDGNIYSFDKDGDFLILRVNPSNKRMKIEKDDKTYDDYVLPKKIAETMAIRTLSLLGYNAEEIKENLKKE